MSIVHKRSTIGFFAATGGGYFAHLDSTAATKAEESAITWGGGATWDGFGCCNGKLDGAWGEHGEADFAYADDEF